MVQRAKVRTAVAAGQSLSPLMEVDVPQDLGMSLPSCFAP